MRPLLDLTLPEADRDVLQGRSVAHAGKARDRLRAQIILDTSEC